MFQNINENTIGTETYKDEKKEKRKIDIFYKYIHLVNTICVFVLTICVS